MGEEQTLSTSATSINGGMWSRIAKRLEVEGNTGDSNKDLDPVPSEQRIWNWWHYISYWISDNFTPSGWRKAAALMQIGMSWRIALLNVAVSEILIALVITVNGYVGAKYNISFTIQSRASFGYYFSILMIFMRMVVGTFWYGISTYTGAECVRSMIYAIWPSFHNVRNTLPESANINTQFMISYLVYFITILPLHYVPIHRIRFLFTIKAIVTPIIGFGIMGWTVKNASVGAESLWTQGNTVHGSTLGWVFMSGVYSNMGGWATLAVNAPDFTRYAISPKHTYTMAIALPLTATLIAFFGVVGAAGSKVLFGQILWDPLLFIDNWTSSGGRAAAFFCGLGFYLAQACANISANSISAANDLNCMFPKYVNIRRGQFIVAFIGAWALTPWNILTGATAFLSFMNGYSVWLGPLCGILVFDFYLVHKRKYNVWELYKKDGIYSYGKYGTNWRSVIAFFIGWVPLFPGFLPSVNNRVSVSAGAIHLYDLGYFYGFGAAGLSYWLICSFWPAKKTMLDRGVYPDDDILIARDVEEEAGSFVDSTSVEKKYSN
ncbi:permease for cytosine/purines, uracil, thiamine, allantoin-domain-containing protein [Lipomyces arxii]|uniref:permease for cytosine/purines, uracil, thiamine, allantoin-domain-containing protein n=1 Tax=Lipomyces arxii TaxID=56418 RepID=UPI0034CDFF9F